MSITLTKHELSAERLVEELPSPVALKVVALVPARSAAASSRKVRSLSMRARSAVTAPTKVAVTACRA